MIDDDLDILILALVLWFWCFQDPLEKSPDPPGFRRNNPFGDEAEDEDAQAWGYVLLQHALEKNNWHWNMNPWRFHVIFCVFFGGVQTLGVWWYAC